MVMAGCFGFVLGLLGAIPVAGPITVLVITRGLRGHVRSAIAIAAGSAVAEGCYAALAFWGLGALVAEHAWIEPVTRGLGGCILAGLAVLLLRSSEPEPPNESLPPRPPRIAGGLALGFGVAAANPTLIVSWAAAVAVLQAAHLVEPTASNARVFAVGTMLGILAWSAALVHLVWRLRARIEPASLERVRRGAGLVVLGLSVAFLWRFAASLG